MNISTLNISTLLLRRVATTLFVLVVFTAGTRLAAQPPVASSTLLVWYDADTNIVVVNSDLVLLHATTIASAGYFHRLTIQIPSDSIPKLKLRPWLRFLSPPLMPVPHILDASRSIIGADQVLPMPFGVVAAVAGLATGAGVTVGVFDAGAPFAHPSFGQRLNYKDIQNPTTSCPFESMLHFTHVAGIIGSTGQANGPVNAWAGIAPEATLYGWSIFNSGTSNPPHSCSVTSNPAQDKLHDALKNGDPIAVVNNSWGLRPSNEAPCDDFGTYDGTCHDYDYVVRAAAVSVFCSAGNFRAACSDYPCTKQTAAGYGLIMSPTVAKNVVSVGALAQDGVTPAYYSSWGPTRDGRVKPDCAAVGSGVVSSVPGSSVPGGGYDSLSGTSMACPMGTGAAALLVQRYRAGHVKPNTYNPDPALIKALLLNTAVDVANPGPDFQTGFGRLDVRRALRALDNGRYQSGSMLNQGNDWEYRFTVTSACTLKVMMVYSDVEETRNDYQDLINDLDLTVDGYDADGAPHTYLPLILNPAQPSAIAVPGVDTRNNVEQIVVPNPAPGFWTIHVHATTLMAHNAPQPFVVTWEGVNDPLADLYMRDQEIPIDLGAEPNPNPGAIWESGDITVRNAPDGDDHPHEDQSPIAGAVNYVYVTVRNRGCGEAAGMLHLYWSKSSTIQSWPEYWDGTAKCNNVPWGGEIGPALTLNVPGFSERTLRFAWTPPGSAGYQGCGADATQFGLLARIETFWLSPFGMTFAESPDLLSNVRGNNNIVLRNVSLVRAGRSGGTGTMVVRGDGTAPPNTGFLITTPANRYGRSLLNVADVRLYLPQNVLDAWKISGVHVQGASADTGAGVRVLQSGARIHGIPLTQDDEFPMTISIRPTINTLQPNEQYQLIIEQVTMSDTETVRSIIRTGARFDTVFVKLDTGTVIQRIGGGTFMVTFADSGTTHGTVTPIADAAAGSITVTPNPAIGSAVVDFTVTSSAHIRITLHDAAGRDVRVVADGEYEPGAHRIPLSLAGIPPGAWFCSMTTVSGTITYPFVVTQ